MTLELENRQTLNLRLGHNIGSVLIYELLGPPLPTPPQKVAIEFHIIPCIYNLLKQYRGVPIEITTLREELQ